MPSRASDPNLDRSIRTLSNKDSPLHVTNWLGHTRSLAGEVGDLSRVAYEPARTHRAADPSDAEERHLEMTEHARPGSPNLVVGDDLSVLRVNLFASQLNLDDVTRQSRIERNLCLYLESGENSGPDRTRP